MTVSVIGDDGDRLPAGAEELLASATLIGGEPAVVRRHLPEGTAIVPIDEVAVPPGPAAVLTTGDPGFFGELRDLRERGSRPTVLPSVSQAQRFAARMGLPWDGMAVVDTRADGGPRRALNICRARRATMVLTSHGAGPSEIASGLAGLPRTLIIAEDLGGRRERISTIDAAEAAAKWWREPNLVICLADPDEVPDRGWYGGGRPTPSSGWASSPADFARKDADLLPDAVLALILARLAPRPGSLVWDVGARSGAVAVECARLGAAVIAIDQDPVQCVRITVNATAAGVECQVVEGEAPTVLRRLARPDSIFIGGGGPEILSYCARAGAARLVIAPRDPGDAGRTRETLRAAGYTVEGSMISMSTGVDLPDGTTRLVAEQPVLVVWGSRDA